MRSGNNAVSPRWTILAKPLLGLIREASLFILTQYYNKVCRPWVDFSIGQAADGSRSEPVFQITLGVFLAAIAQVDKNRLLYALSRRISYLIDVISVRLQIFTRPGCKTGDQRTVVYGYRRILLGKESVFQ